MSDLDFDDDDDEYQFEYSDEDGEEDEPDVELQNQYYIAKAVKQESLADALQSFQKVLEIEAGNKGDWGFKALKQMIKCLFKLKRYPEMMERYKELLTYIKAAVTKNYSEKSIKSILDNISLAKDFNLLQIFYQTTLEALKETRNDRLWFRTNLKLGKLYFDMKDYARLNKILRELYASCQNDDGEEDSKKGTQLLEVYALEIQLCTELKNNKRQKALYEQSQNVKSAISHPEINGIIRECGGKMHLRQGEFKEAHTAFFEAFKNYDESGNPRRIACLKYLVLANMLMISDINPFDSQETKPYKTDPEIVVMTDLVDAYQRNDVETFQKIITDNHNVIMEDTFIKEHIDELLLNIRRQVIQNLIKPYKRIRLEYISQKLKIDISQVEELLVSLILDEKISAQIDQPAGLLVMQAAESAEESRYSAVEEWANQLSEFHSTLVGKVAMKSF